MAMYDITSEKMLEENLIHTLVRSGYWTYEKDLDTEEKLWQNLRDIIEKNNKAILDDVMLTDQEFAQIKDQLTFNSAFKAAKFLRGENGKAKVRVQRDDTSLGEVYLLVLDNRDIAGGTSVYQLINQFRSVRRHAMDGDSRFDVTLLINGLPLIHIELKNANVGYMEAFNQIKEYSREGKFNGIYSACQMFVVTNGSQTRYIAPASHENLNSKFLSPWVDRDNKKVENYLDFAKEVLTIPQAHRLVSNYTVLDYDRESLILLRPYQIHAVKAVMENYKKGSGYIWHTTGSGKTLTSYKLSKNILEGVPNIDKSVFIVDRIDLDNQTTGAFNSYARGDFMDVEETENVNGLVKKLTDGHRSLVITTIQKLNYLIKRYKDKKDNKTCKKLRDLKLVFVVDECHRAVSSEKQREINKFFKNPRWYGFTGTPIFAENQKQAKGDLARTTRQQYGPCLHEYTVKNAIEDKAVLGFQVEYKSTISEDGLYDIVMNENDEIDYFNSDKKDLEALIPRSVFDEDDHMIEVIDTIVNKSRIKFGLDRGAGNSFGAILTTSSIEKAQRYYELFSMLKEDKLDIKISDKVKSQVSDFPKVAITYSLTENKEESGLNKEKMKKSLADYNQMYGTNFSLDEIKGYNANLNDRLARKMPKYKIRSEQVDIVIVVDRLLTGFDSPSLALLFMDRPPMTPQNLIQAFSRTNRIYNKYKAYGQIVTFQTPAIYKEAIEEAFSLYSNGGEDYIQAPSYEESLEKFEQALENFRLLVQDPTDFDRMNDIEDKAEFAKRFQALDKALANIRVYGEFDEEEFQAKYDLNQKDLEEYNGRYVNIKEELKDFVKENEEEGQQLDFGDIGYESLTVDRQKIDSRFLDSLMDAAAKESPDLDRKERENTKIFKELRELLEKLKKENPKAAGLYEEVSEDMLENPSKYKEMNMTDFMKDLKKDYYDKGIKKIAEVSKASIDDVVYFASTFDKDDKEKETKALKYITSRADMVDFLEKNNMTPLKGKKKFRNLISKIIEDDIMPYES